MPQITGGDAGGGAGGNTGGGNRMSPGRGAVGSSGEKPGTILVPPGTSDNTRENRNRKKPRLTHGPGINPPVPPAPIIPGPGIHSQVGVAPPPPIYPQYPYPGQTVIPMAGVPTHVAEPGYWQDQLPGQDTWDRYNTSTVGPGMTAEQALQARAAAQQNAAQAAGTPVDWNAPVIVPGPGGFRTIPDPNARNPSAPETPGPWNPPPEDQGGKDHKRRRGPKITPTDPGTITNLLNTGGRQWQGSRIYDMPDAIQQKIFQTGRGQILTQLLGALGFQMGGYQGQYGFPSSWIVPEGFTFGPEVGALLAQLPDIDRQNLMDFLGQQFNFQIDQSGNPLVPAAPGQTSAAQSLSGSAGELPAVPQSVRM